jgi:hypothetical protein
MVYLLLFSFFTIYILKISQGKRCIIKKKLLGPFFILVHQSLPFPSYLPCGILLFFIHLFTCAHIVWAISPPYHPLPPYPPPTPSLPGRTCSALISNFVEEKT